MHSYSVFGQYPIILEVLDLLVYLLFCGATVVHIFYMEIFWFPDDKHEGVGKPGGPPAYMRWPHMKADSVRGLTLREIGGGFSRHLRAPSVRAACYAIAKPSTMVQKMQNIKRLRGHRNAVYCGNFFVIRNMSYNLVCLLVNFSP